VVVMVVLVVDIYSIIGGRRAYQGRDGRSGAVPDGAGLLLCTPIALVALLHRRLPPRQRGLTHAGRLHRHHIQTPNAPARPRDLGLVFSVMGERLPTR
jgi:hypothetical protein